MTPEIANKIYDILIRDCGASPLYRKEFVQHHSSWNSKNPSEFRFQGMLGFGGKFWYDPFRVATYRVSCYGEDRTAKRDRMIDKANAALAVLAKT